MRWQNQRESCLSQQAFRGGGKARIAVRWAVRRGDTEGSRISEGLDEVVFTGGRILTRERSIDCES